MQTADGALGVIDEKLIRMKELAEQAATGTYNSDQRLIIDSEYQAMASEITRIANATDFNGIYLLNGNLSSATHSGSGLVSTGTAKNPLRHSERQLGGLLLRHRSTAPPPRPWASGSARPASGTQRRFSISTQSRERRTPWSPSRTPLCPRTRSAPNWAPPRTVCQNTISNLQIQAENLQAAESRISDVDVSLEMTEFVRQQILSQAARCPCWPRPTPCPDWPCSSWAANPGAGDRSTGITPTPGRPQGRPGIPF